MTADWQPSSVAQLDEVPRKLVFGDARSPENLRDIDTWIGVVLSACLAAFFVVAFVLAERPLFLLGAIPAAVLPFSVVRMRKCGMYVSTRGVIVERFWKRSDFRWDAIGFALVETRVGLEGRRRRIVLNALGGRTVPIPGMACPASSSPVPSSLVPLDMAERCDSLEGLTGRLNSWQSQFSGRDEGD